MVDRVHVYDNASVLLRWDPAVRSLDQQHDEYFNRWYPTDLLLLLFLSQSSPYIRLVPWTALVPSNLIKTHYPPTGQRTCFEEGFQECLAHLRAGLA